MNHERESILIEIDSDTLLEQYMLLGVIYRPPAADVN